MRKEWIFLLIFDLFLFVMWVVFVNSFQAQGIFDFTGAFALVMFLFIAFLAALTIAYFLTKGLIKSVILGVLNSMAFFSFVLVVSYFSYKFG